MKSLIFLAILSFSLFACERSDNTSSSYTDADNTGRNIRDRNSDAVLPTNQSENDEDRAITQRIRQAIMADDTLTNDAKNIKVITIKRVVTLRGPVNTAEEKENITKKANQTKGVAEVDNQLEVIGTK